MAMLNIPSSNSDPNYRYRMPRLVSKIEGRGNGIKTNIMNMGDIARALKRPPEYTTKFCGTELGTQSKFDTAEGKSIVNGAHDPRDLQVLIDKFVEKYVLCPNCSLPEIDLVLKKGLVGCNCNACGYNGNLDNVHKLASFMLRNPPKGGDSTMGKQKEGRSKAERREKKKSKATGLDDVKEGDEDDDDAEGEKKKKKKSKSSKKSKKDEDDVDVSDCDVESNEVGGDGVTKTAAKAKVAEGHSASSKKKKSKGIGNDEQLLDKESLTFDSAEIAEVKSRLLTFTRDGKVTPEEFFTELRVLQVSQDFDSILRLFLVLDVLLTPDWNAESGSSVAITAEMVEEILPFLRKVVDSSMDTGQTCFALENFIVMRGLLPVSANNLAFILHKLFLAELLDEDSLILRYSDTDETSATTVKKKKKSSKHVSANEEWASVSDLVKTAGLQAFIKWLKEGEAETDEEEEEEEDSQPPTLQETTQTESPDSSPSGPVAKVKEDEDEFDIDDI